jgi:hypothetical protein
MELHAMTPDIFTDQFQVHLHPYAATCIFLRSVPSTKQAIPMMTVRMSIEHSKALTFILHRQILSMEHSQHVSYPVPLDCLHGMQIAEEDWLAFWRT